MKRIIIVLILLLLPYNLLLAQSETTKYKLVRIFDDAFSLIVSDDNKLIALITENNKLEIFNLKSLALVRRVKVTRNTWLHKGFFDNNNQFLYFSYGMQMKIKYRELNIGNGKVKKVNCADFSKGCSYRAIKICDYENKVLSIENGKYRFVQKGLLILMYKKLSIVHNKVGLGTVQ